MRSVPQVFADGALALTEPSEGHVPSRDWVLAASALGSCVVFASSGIVNLGLAAMGHDLRMTPQQLQWVVNAELLPLAALTLAVGAAGDRFGQRQMFLLGLSVFTFATLASAFATKWETLVSARLLVGIGETLILPNGMSILGRAFPAESRARAVGIWSSVAAIASAIAPAVAGLLLAHGSWRMALLIPVPIALTAAALAVLWIPNSPPNRAAPIDISGASLSALALGGLAWSLTRLTNSGRASIQDLGVLVGAVAAVAALVFLERLRGDRAMLPPVLFASRSVFGANLYTVLLYGPFTIVLTLIPFTIIRGTHLPTIVAGLAFVPLQATITFISPMAGLLCRRLGRRQPLFIGSLLVAAGCALGLRIENTASYWHDIFPLVLLVAIGVSAAFAPLTTLVLTSVGPEHAGVASGVNSALSRAGSLLAIALLGGVLRMGGPELFRGLHAALIASAVSCLAATLAVFIIEPGPHVDYVPPP
jgi:MFS family permease